MKKKGLGCLPGRHHNTTTILREGSSLRLPFRLWTQHLPVSVIFFIFLPMDTTFADVHQFYACFASGHNISHFGYPFTC